MAFTARIRPLALCAAALACGASPGAQPFASLDALARGVLAQKHAPSLSVAIVRDGQIVYDRAFGAGVTPQTAYEIGSVTKIFTAVCVMQLAQAGKLSVDDALAAYVPSFPNAAAITLRELLVHRSGVADDLPAAARAGLVYAPVTLQRLLAFAATLPPDFAPNADWNYSNTGYALLGAVVERVSGEPLAPYEREHIFAPAGMIHTWMGSAPPGALAPGESLQADAAAVPVRVWNPSWLFGAGDVVSTAGDLARFDIALMNGTLVSHATLAQMAKPESIATLVPGTRDGLGLFETPFGPLTFVGHHGGEPGYVADDEMLPVQGFAIVLLANAQFDTAPLFTRIAARFYPRAAAFAKAYPPHTPDPDPASTARLLALTRRLARGAIDRAQFSARANAALTPALLASLPTQLAPLGRLESLEFATAFYDGGLHYLRYDMRFARRTSGLTLLVSLNARGKIDTFLIR